MVHAFNHPPKMGRLVMKKKNDGFLLLSVIVLGGIALVFERIGLIPLAGVAVVIVGFSIFIHMTRRRKQQDACDQLALLVFRNQVPWEEEKKLNTKLAKKNFRVAALIRDLQILRDSIEIALTSKKRETAEGRFKDARLVFARIRKEHTRLIKSETFTEISSAVARLDEEFPTKLYLNLAQGHLDRAEKVKTEKSKGKYIKLARETLTEGINSGKCRVSELKAALKKVDPRSSS
jgi:hypothetical protein